MRQSSRTSSGPSRHSAILSHADQLYGVSCTALTSVSSAARRRSLRGASSRPESDARALKACGAVGGRERNRRALLRGVGIQSQR